MGRKFVQRHAAYVTIILMRTAAAYIEERQTDREPSSGQQTRGTHIASAVSDVKQHVAVYLQGATVEDVEARIGALLNDDKYVALRGALLAYAPSQLPVESIPDIPESWLAAVGETNRESMLALDKLLIELARQIGLIAKCLSLTNQPLAFLDDIDLGALAHVMIKDPASSDMMRADVCILSVMALHSSDLTLPIDCIAKMLDLAIEATRIYVRSLELFRYDTSAMLLGASDTKRLAIASALILGGPKAARSMLFDDSPEPTARARVTHGAAVPGEEVNDDDRAPAENEHGLYNDPYFQWIDENIEKLRGYTNEFVAIDLTHGVVVHSANSEEFSAEIEKMPAEQRERLMAFHTSMFI